MVGVMVVLEGVWEGEAEQEVEDMGIMMEVMVEEMEDMVEEVEDMEMDIVEEVVLEVVVEGVEEVDLVESKRSSQTTKSLSRDYPQMSLRRILLNSLDPLALLRMTAKLENSVSLSILTEIQVYQRVKLLSPMMTRVQLKVLFNGLMEKTSMVNQ